MWILFTGENVKALIFKSVFETPPGTIVVTLKDMYKPDPLEINFPYNIDTRSPRGQSSVVGGLKWWLSRGCKRPFHREAQIWVKQYLA